MDDRQHQAMIRAAQSAIELAQGVREYHRKRTKPGDRARVTDLKVATSRLKRAMAPIRSALGHAPYDPIDAEHALWQAEWREWSDKIQVERRKLWKMHERRDRTRRRS